MFISDALLFSAPVLRKNMMLTRRFLLAVRLAVWKTFAHPRAALLSARMAVWIVVISAATKLTSLPRAQKIAAFGLRPVARPSGSDTPAKLARTIDSLLAMNLFVFRQSCWKRALVLHRYLALNGIESQIKFGLKKEPATRMDGHAWLEHHGEPLLEDNAANYVITFSLPAEYSSATQSAS